MARANEMSLREAISALAKNPVPVTPLNSKITEVVPALYYTNRVENAIDWLIKRYNDGTLQVIGYSRAPQLTKDKALKTASELYEERMASLELANSKLKKGKKKNGKNSSSSK